MSHPNPFSSFMPAPVNRRVVAALIDLLVLAVISALYFLVPLVRYGLVLPMWGVLAAVLGYAVVPLASFRATLGMKLLGLQLVGRDGRAANAGDLLFRELIGRGMFPGAYLATLVAGAIGSWVGVLSFRAPTGMALWVSLMSLAAVSAALVGAFVSLGRPDGRGLADLLARTMVVSAVTAAEPIDEDDRQALRAEHRRRVGRVVAFEVVLAGLVWALPYLLSRPAESTETYADRLTRSKLENDFQANPSSARLARDLADSYRRAGEQKKAREVEARHVQAVENTRPERVKMALLTPKFEANPCERSVALDLGNALNAAGEFEAALRLVERYDERCERWPRLWWVSTYAHQQRGRWAEASSVVSRLIEDAPDDSDFWWWRGESYAQQGNYPQAVADFLQSMAVHPNGFAVDQLSQWGEASGVHPCEVALAVQYLLEQSPESADDWSAEELEALKAEHQCGQRIGKGTVVLSFPSGASWAKTAARFNGKSVVARVHPRQGYTVLSRQTAEALKLEVPEGPRVSLFVEERLAMGVPVTVGRVEVGPAILEQVPVMVVDELPERVAAVIGLNFIWHFSLQAKERSLSLTPLARAR